MGSRKESPRERDFLKQAIQEIAAKHIPQQEARERAEREDLRRLLNADELGYDWWRIRGSWICRRRERRPTE